MSDTDIESGRRWNDQIAASLDETDFGIVCVTAANQHRPWLVFEAGALAKRLEVARLVPLCIDLDPSAVTGPLASFQARRLDKEGMRTLAQDLSARRDEPLSSQEVDELFDDAWHRLDSKVKAAMEQAPESEEADRSEKDMLKELVDRVRGLERPPQLPAKRLHAGEFVTLSDGTAIPVPVDPHARQQLEDFANRVGLRVVSGWSEPFSVRTPDIAFRATTESRASGSFRSLSDQSHGQVPPEAARRHVPRRSSDDTEDASPG